MQRVKLRVAEWIALAFFTYVASISPWFPERPGLAFQPLIILLAVAVLVILLALGARSRFATTFDVARDWVPLGLTLLAFREMEFFVPLKFRHTHETIWVQWDHYFLVQAGGQRLIESLGSCIPSYLELCYLLVYGVGAFCVGALYWTKRRKYADRFLTVYLLGTLGAYALFPYFPTQPPRNLFANMDPPNIHTALRTFNEWILRNGTIHSSVFPSAHVSSAFSAAWGMFLVLPERKAYGWGLLIYAISVSIATIYGRYHYAADVLAGLGISLAAAGIAMLWRKLGPWRPKY